MSSPLPIFGSQDLKDDDGQVVDSFLIETDAPPDLKQVVEPIPVLTPVAQKFPTTLVTGFQIVTAGMTDPFPLFPPDLNRVFGKVRITSLNATPDLNQWVLVATDKSLLTNDAATGINARSGVSYRARQGQAIDIDSHTGGLWVVGNASIATEGIEVSWILVTATK